MSFLTHEGSKQQIVGQAEILPCLMARLICGQRLTGRAALNYVDNEAARFALIKGGSPTMDSAWLAMSFWRADSDLLCHSWFERVPSASNISDGPSRGADIDPVRLSDRITLQPKRVDIPPHLENELLEEWSGRVRQEW